MKHGTPGAGLAALILRVVLGLTFVWAGAGKLLVTLPYSGQAAADLANAGAPIAPVTTPPAPAPPAAPNPPSRPAPTPATVLPPPTTPLPDPEDPVNPQAPGTFARARAALPLAVLWTDTSGHQAAAATPATAPGPAPGLVPVRAFVAAQFPAEVRVRRVYEIAAQVRRASLAPTPGSWRLMPAVLGLEPWPVRLAWAVAVAELVAGLLLLAGFLSRLASLPLIGIIATGVWLTQIGPAMQSGAVRLWILPDRTWWDPAQWSTLLWQLALLAMLKAQVLLGSGTLSVDRALFGRARSGGGPPEPKMDP